MQNLKLWRLADGIVFGLVVGMAALLFLLSAQRGRAQMLQPQVEVQLGNAVVGIYPLSEDRTISVGDGNRFMIENGTVRMIEADCPDQICVHMASIGAEGGTIVCLPNHVLLRVRDTAPVRPEVDSVAE